MIMFRLIALATTTALTLQACSPAVPASNAGIGMGDLPQFEADRIRRNAALNGETTTFGSPSAISATAISPSTAGTTVAGRGGLQASPGNAAPVLVGNAGISDEQDFNAVSNRETIQSDAERRAAQAAARQQIDPTAIPERPQDTGPNIVEYALNAPNVKGQEWYSRSIFATQRKFVKNCAKYPTPDAAQRDFMQRGGPDRDRLGLDPDGDGFACAWDPAPFKVVLTAEDN